MRNILIVFILTLFIFNAEAAKITDDSLLIGRPGSSADKIIKTSDGGFLKKVIGGDWLFSNDGILEKKIGSGSGSGGSGGINLALNSSFEDGLTNWTNTGGTLSQQTYANGVEGDLKFARFIATAAGQYLETDLYTKPDNISGGCMMDFKYIQGDNAFEYKVFNSAAALPANEISTGTLSDLTEWVKAPTQTFDCNAQMKLRIISLGAGTIDIDSAYLGSNKGFIASFGKKYGYALTFDATSGGAINVINLDNISSSIIRNSVGNYDVFFNSSLITVSPEVNFNCFEGSPYVRGVTTSKVNVICQTTAGVNVDVSDFNLHIIPRGVDAQSTSQEAYTPEQASFFVSANISTESTSLSNPALFVTKIVTTGVMVVNKGSAKIPCSGSNPSTGLTCAVGNEELGISVNIPVAGRYKVCQELAARVNSMSQVGSLKIALTENDSDAILIDSTNVVGFHSAGANASSVSFSLCEYFDIASAGEKTFRMFYTKSDGNVTLHTLNNSSNPSADGVYRITVELVSNFAARPVIQNMVDTSVKSGVRIESCRINNNGTASKGGDLSLCDWLNTPSRTSNGQVEVLIKTGIFSFIPNCTMQTLTDARVTTHSAEATTTTISTITRNFAETLEDRDFIIECIGAR